MQTFKEKVAILAQADSMRDLQFCNPDLEQDEWCELADREAYALLYNSTLRLKPKTITRTITTPIPITLQWAEQNPNSTVFNCLTNLNFGVCVNEISDFIYKAGLVFATKADADFAHNAFLESMK
jgi:hypothetical protein